MRPKLLLDIDGILTDFHAAVARVAVDAGFDIALSRMSEWEMSASLRKAGAPEPIVEKCMSAMASEGFNERLEPSPEALKNLPRLQEIADVVFVTAPNLQCSTWMNERIAWMRHHFNVEPECVVFSCEKQEVFGDAFVDDNPKNVLDWSERHPKNMAALWDAPYNRGVEVKRRLRSWLDLTDFVELVKHRLA